jgi:anti-anti-sigma factor
VNSATVIVIPNSSLKGEAVTWLRAELSKLESPGGKLVLDMSKVEEVESEGAGAILEAARSMRSSGGILRLCGLNKEVAGFLELLQVNRAVEVYTSQSDAIRARSKF